MKTITLTNYGKIHNPITITLPSNEDLHRTYGGELTQADFNYSGNVIKKIIRAKSFDNMCAANCRNQRKLVSNV